MNLKFVQDKFQKHVREKSLLLLLTIRAALVYSLIVYLPGFNFVRPPAFSGPDLSS